MRIELRAISRLLAVAALAGLAAGCAAPEPERVDDPSYVHDPYEGFNRKAHSVNVGLDRAVVRPASKAYDAVTPAFGKYVVSNAVNTLKMPKILGNRILQGDVEGSLSALMRLSMNVAFGAGGLLDPATEMGLPLNDTDFGVTLAKYGVAEGGYLELPVFGPGTVRSQVGRVVDTAFDPLTYVSGTPATEIGYGARAAAIIDFRHDNAAAIDQAFYESEDSYVTTRAAYLQSRRRQVAGETTEEALPDVFDN
jgi:phospholipid-binding lipoprotein MlaA